MNVSTLFKQFQQLTDDQSAALLTLAAVIAKSQPNDQLLTVKQAAERLAVSSDAIYEMCECGKLPHQRIGKGRGTIRIAASALEASQQQPIKLRRLVG